MDGAEAVDGGAEAGEGGGEAGEGGVALLGIRVPAISLTEFSVLCVRQPVTEFH